MRVALRCESEKHVRRDLRDGEATTRELDGDRFVCALDDLVGHRARHSLHVGCAEPTTDEALRAVHDLRRIDGATAFGLVADHE
jgi:hypothetical protein